MKNRSATFEPSCLSVQMALNERVVTQNVAWLKNFPLKDLKKTDIQYGRPRKEAEDQKKLFRLCKVFLRKNNFKRG